MKNRLTISFILFLGLFASELHAQPRLTEEQRQQLHEAKSREERDRLLQSWGVPVPHFNEIPPPLKEKLSASQQAEFLKAGSFEERMQLLKSWNVRMPEPPRDGGGRHRPPPPDEAPSDEIPTNNDGGGAQ